MRAGKVKKTGESVIVNRLKRKFEARYCCK